MIYKYEMACREAGMTEEQIREIRKVFDNDRKKLKRENKKLEEFDLTLVWVSEECEGEDGRGYTKDIPDDSFNLEERTIEKLLLADLHGYLEELSEQDRDILLSYYEDRYGAIAEVQRRYGMTRKAMDCRRKKLFAALKEKFSV